MDTILQGLQRVICYIDYILVTGATESEHLHNLEKLLQRLQEHGIRVNKAKYSFMCTEVQYLGHRIDAEGIHPNDSKLQAIQQAPAPKNLQELRSFLGLLNYYGRFIPNLPSLLHPRCVKTHHGHGLQSVTTPSSRLTRSCCLQMFWSTMTPPYLFDL